jgi:hypothetical protein
MKLAEAREAAKQLAMLRTIPYSKEFSGLHVY